MSDLSLLTGVYTDVEAYGEMIDRVIKQLAQGVPNPPDPDQKKLGQLLMNAGDQGLESQSLEALILDTLLRSNTGEPLAGLQQLGKCLLNGQVDISAKKQLEALAQRLEQERAEIARRLWRR